MTNKTPTSLLRRAGLLVLLWCAGLYLRIPILVAPALAPMIDQELGLGPAAVGALTTLPVLMLAAGAVVGALVIKRMGARNALAMALLLTAVASAARGLAPPISLLFIATVVTGFGIAIMQPALPALVVNWCPGFTSLAVAVYMNGMFMGEFIGAGLTLPVALPLANGSWRVALLLWTIPAIPLVAALYLPRSHSFPAPKIGVWMPDWGDGRLWHLGALLGATSAVFFGTNAYMGEILSARGEAALLGQGLWWLNLSQAAASLGLLAFARHLVGRRLPILATALLVSTSLAAFMFLQNDAALVAVFVLGFASSAQLILLVAVIPHLAGASEAGRLSAGMFAIGYAIAFSVPLLGGSVAEFAGPAIMTLLPTLLYATASIVFIPRLRLTRDY